MIVDFLHRFEQKLRQEANLGNLNRQLICDELARIGFVSVRYYDVVQNIYLDQSYLCLTHYKNGSTVDLGKMVSTSDVSSSDPSTWNKIGYVNREASNYSDVLKRFDSEIGLSEQKVLRIPIRTSEELFGVIFACVPDNWDCENGELNLALEMAGTIIGRTWRYAKNAAIEYSTKKIQDTIQSTPINSIGALLEKSNRLFLETAKSSVSSIFEYNWLTHTVQKVTETTSEDLLSSVDEFREEYGINESLTGKAFVEERYRYIPRFSTLTNSRPNLVIEESVVRHAKMLGEMSSILYLPVGGHGSLGQSAPRFLVRLVNRQENIKLPFTRWQTEVLQMTSDRASRLLDEKIAEIQLRNFRQIAIRVLPSFSEVQELAEDIAAQLRGDLINGFIFLSRTKDADRFNQKVGAGNFCRLFHSDLEVQSKEPIFNKRKFLNSNNVLVRLSDFNEDEEGLTGRLVAHGVIAILFIRTEVVGVEGFFGIPILTSENLQNLVNRIPQETLLNLQSYSSLLTQAAKYSDSLLTAESALQLIGHIGHEFDGPISAMAGSAQEVVNKLRKQLRDDPATTKSLVSAFGPTPSKSIEEAHDRIQKYQQLVSSQMNVAVDMALHVDGILEATFERFNMSNVLHEAKHLIEGEVDIFQNNDEDRFYTCNVKLNSRAKDDHYIIGDQMLIAKAVQHVLRNALKYSIPNGESKEIGIELEYVPQSHWHIYRIQNFGTHLPNHMWHQVKQPFKRGNTSDKIRARRGMGLGLFLVEQFCCVHGGSVNCVKSDNVLGDADRFNELCDTIFELRIAKNLEAGTTKMRINL